MKLHVDLETLQLIEGPGFRNPVGTLRFKRGDAARLEVMFLRNGTTASTIGDPQLLELQFGVKPRGRYDIGYLVHSSDWTMPADGANPPAYLCSPSFNTVELDSALGVGSSTGTELSEITLMGEITWREGTGEPTSTRTFLVIVENDVNRGTEGVPVSAEPAYPAPESIELLARKGQPDGYAGLDPAGKVPAAQLAISATSISDSTTTGRNLIKASNATTARSVIGAMAAPSVSGASLYGLNQSLDWVGITQGRRALLSAPTDYSNFPLPEFFKGLSLYLLDEYFLWFGYTLADLISYMESYHGGSTFWTQVLTAGTNEWTVPGFAILNTYIDGSIPLGALSSWPAITSQPGRENPGAEVYLDPGGMAVVRFVSNGLVSVQGDLTAGPGGYGSY